MSLRNRNHSSIFIYFHLFSSYFHWDVHPRKNHPIRRGILRKLLAPALPSVPGDGCLCSLPLGEGTQLGTGIGGGAKTA